MTPKDINYLANLWDSNRAYFEHFVSGIAQFSGTGTVDSTKLRDGSPDLEIDMGVSGQVACQGVSLKSIHPGDRIVVSGSVYWATPASEMAADNRIIRADPQHGPLLKEKDVLYLIPGTCTAGRVK
jgi:hypothetical protein